MAKKNNDNIKINTNKDSSIKTNINDKKINTNNEKKGNKVTTKNINKNNKVVKNVKMEKEKIMKVKVENSRVTKNKGIYLETDDYLKENNLDATFVDKKINIDDEFVDKKDKHIFLKVIFGLFVFVLICFSCYSLYVFITYEPEVKTKIVKEKEMILDENVVFLGDSITDFYDLDKYYPDVKVVNSGIDGNSTYQVLDDMKERVYIYNPSKVFILIGTNDIIHGKNVDEIVNNIKKIMIIKEGMEIKNEF